MIPHSRPTMGSREAAVAARVVRSGTLSQGPEVAAFEAEAARFIGVRGGVAVSSGTTALTLALRALGAGPGKEVLVPAYARGSLAQAVRAAGAEPVLVDVHWHDMNISYPQARRRLTHRTAALIALHSFGAAAELDPLLSLGLPIVEDLTQAFGAVDYNRSKLGSFGHAALVSFGAGGLLTSAGEGGMILSDERRLLDAARDLRECGDRPVDVLRVDARMTEVQAAVGRVQLRRLPALLDDRRRRAKSYRLALEDLPAELPLEVFGRVYAAFVLRLRRPLTEALLEAFRARGVEARRPVDPLPSREVPGAAAPVAERLWRRALSLPLFPSLSGGEARRVVSAAQELLK